MANQLLNLDVDWASKTGAADSTVAFNETFDVKINGVGELVGTLRFVLLSQNVSDEDAILWTFIPSDYEKTEDGGAIIRNVCINTRDALDMLKQQGGKSKLFLSLLADSDGKITDYGISKISLTLGSFLEDPNLPPNTEIGGMSVGELKIYVEEMLKRIQASESAAEDAKNEAKEYADEAKGVKGIAQQASADATEAKQKAEVAEQVAKGAQYAKVFATETEMKTWAAAEMAKAEAEREVKVGDNLYIEALDVPDYWWTGEGNGYAQLETGAVKVEVDSALDANSTNPVQNKKVKEALDGKFAKSGDDNLPAGKYGWSLGTTTQSGVVVGGWGTRASTVDLNNYTVFEYDRIDVNRGGKHEYFALTGDTEDKVARKKDLNSIPVGGCIKFGEAKLKHYNSGGDIRFNLAGGTFCVEGGWLILGNGAQFRAGDFCVPGYELGEILNNAKNGGGGSEGTPYLAVGDGCSVPAVAGTAGIALGRGAGYKNSSAATLTGTIAIGELATPFCNYSIVIGNNSCSSKEYQILIGYAIDGDSSLRSYVDNASCSSYAIMLQACSTGVFFASDACNGYATTIGYKKSDGCYEERRIEEAFSGGTGGGSSYIKASQSDPVGDIPGCSTGIAIGPNARIGNDVTNGVAIGLCVMATNATPVVIGNGCSAITVNSNYELCVGGYPVGDGGSSNDSICVYDSEGYCATGLGTNYVAIGNESIAYDDSVAVGANTYANQGEVAIGPNAGNGAPINSFTTENSLYNVRRFRACSCSAGNELFFATKDDKAVLGGEFDRKPDGNASLCYFYLQDVASRKETVFGNFAEDYGSNGVVIGEEAATHSNSRSDVAIGYKAGVDPLFLSIVNGNSLSNIRAFAAGYDSMGNRGDTAFFASCNGEVVIGGLTSYGGNAYGYRFISLSDIIGAVENAGCDYALVELESTNGNFDPIFNAQNKAMNVAAASSSWSTVTLVMPPPVDGVARDFILTLENCVDGHSLIVSGEGAPLLLPRDGDDSNLVPEAGTNVFMFTEIKPNVFLVSRTKVVEA